MDNVSHTVAGLLIAEAAIQLRTARGNAPSLPAARAAFWLSALANNLPDFDFVYTSITGPEPLGYLLHHRGHTHTLPVALLLSLAMLALWASFGRRFRERLAPGEWRFLAGLGVLGGFVHIAMDFTNNYGVHPFWPVFDGWVYGDFVFIVEPLFLVIGIPPLLLALRSRVTRGLLALVLLAVLVLAWLVPFVTALVAAVLSGLGLAWLLLGRRLERGKRIAITFVAAALVALTFFVSRLRAEALARASLSPGARLEELVLTPAPANPLCWSAFRISVRGPEYVAERGVVSVLPGLVAPASCPMRDAGTPTAPMAAPTAAGDAAFEVTGVFTAPLAELSELARDNCFAAAFLRYARAPFWTGRAPGEVLGDLRYDRSPEVEFAELVLPAAGECPRFVPSWIPPRRDLLK